MISIISKAQLGNFTIDVAKTNDESCPSNGGLSWSTVGTTSGSTLSYSIIDVNTNIIIASTSDTFFSSLTAGTYKVVATQNLGTQSNQATSAYVTILNNKQPLAYTVTVNSNEVCGHDGEFTVNVISGKPAYTYQLLDSSLNVVLSQSSNVFHGLNAGNYYVRVVDQCGSGVAQAVTILNTPSKITDVYHYGVSESKDCNTLILNQFSIRVPSDGNGGYSSKFPYTITFSYVNPVTGNAETVSNVVSSSSGGSYTNNYYDYQIAAPSIPNFSAVTNMLSVNLTIIDGCGNIVYTRNPYNIAFTFNPDASILDATCGGKYVYSFTDPLFRVENSNISTNLVSAPAGYNSSNFPASSPFGDYTHPLPAGDYIVDVIDICGNKTKQVKFTITSTIPTVNNSTLPSCTDGLGNLIGDIDYPLEFSSVKITSAPAAFTMALPYTIPADNFYDRGSCYSKTPTSFFLNDLPPGTYSYQYSTSCDPATYYNSSFTIIASSNNSTATISQQGCQTLKVNYTLSLTPGISQYTYILLQRYYPEYDTWSSPSSYIDPSSGAVAGAVLYSGWGSSNLSGNQTLGNMPTGKYRVVTMFNYNKSGMGGNCATTRLSNCTKVISSVFEAAATLVFNNAYAFQCQDKTFDVAISASAGTQLTYSVVSDGTSSATTIIDNNTNPIFHGLTAGSYYFRVTDACGNFITRKLDLAYLTKPKVRLVPDCVGNTLKLVIDGLDYLNFQWYKTDNPDDILSTNNVLDLRSFTPSDAGIYKARIYSTNLLYCIDYTAEMRITPDALNSVSSGTGQSVIINYNPIYDSVNLFSYLQGQYDSFGTWTEITTPVVSNLLVGDEWKISSAQSGTYTFRYTVSPLCGGSTKYTDVVIKLVKVCYKLPVVNGGITEDTKVGITAFGRAGDSPDVWPGARKGGWIALESVSKGFVVNRMAFDTNHLPVGIPQSKFVAGMMVYDTTNHCLKIYNGSYWSCYTNQTCPE